ncbi:GNAT family N-acetyltransferase [Pararhodobacter sp.]|uniref:GNAT family N-acetyltransferase n=1 Tax=Pararhodobacter sp. TaxID=2127056 RepID=UPI002FDFC101
MFALTAAAVRKLAPLPYPAEVVETWMTGRTPEDYRADCAEGRIWIAEADGLSLGFAQGEPGEVKRLFVRADHAGRGLGRALMERALADALAAGDRVVRIEATLNAVPFYHRWGFVEVGRGIFPGRDGLPQIDVVHLEARF